MLISISGGWRRDLPQVEVQPNQDRFRRRLGKLSRIGRAPGRLLDGMVVVTRTTLYLRLQRCLVIEVWIADLHPPGRRRESSETTGPCSEIHPSVSIDVISSRSQRPQARRYGRNATGEPVAALRRARGSAAGARRKRRSAHPLDLCRASRGLLEGF